MAVVEIGLTTSREPRLLPLADALGVLTFATVGLLSHDHALSLTGYARDALPVLVGWFAAALVFGAYMGKQYVLFGMTLSSSFAGDSFCKGLGRHCHADEPVAVDVPTLPAASAARVLERPLKLRGYYNYNRLEALQQSLAQVTGKRVAMDVTVDPALIGGVVARIGSSIYDGSVVRQLERMKSQLAQEG